VGDSGYDDILLDTYWAGIVLLARGDALDGYVWSLEQRNMLVSTDYREHTGLSIGEWPPIGSPEEEALIAALLGVFHGGGTGSLTKNAPTKITGYAPHGLDQAIMRDGVGVSTRAILDAVKRPLRVELQANGNWRFTGKDAVVVLNQNGQVVTTWARNHHGYRVDRIH
jgi:hypothetical protein